MNKIKIKSFISFFVVLPHFGKTSKQQTTSRVEPSKRPVDITKGTHRLFLYGIRAAWRFRVSIISPEDERWTRSRAQDVSIKPKRLRKN